MACTFFLFSASLLYENTNTSTHNTIVCACALAQTQKCILGRQFYSLSPCFSVSSCLYIYIYICCFFFTQLHFSLFFFILCYLSSCNLDCIPRCLGSHLPCKLVLTHTSLYSLTYTTFSEKRKINAPHCLVSERAKERKEEGLASRPVLRFNSWLYSPFSLLPSHFLSSTFLALLLRRFS